MLNGFKPERLLIISFLLWLVFFLTKSGEYVNLGPLWFPVIVLVIYNLSFLFGANFLKRTKEIIVKEKAFSSKDRYIIFITFICGVIGVSLRLYQRVFEQQLLTEDNSFESRLKLLVEGSNPGITSFISAFFFPFAFIALSYATYYFRHIPKYFYVLIFAFGIYPIVDSLFYQGRLIIVLYSLMFLFVVVFRVVQTTRLMDDQINFKFGKIRLLTIPRYISKKRFYFFGAIILTVFLNYSIAVMTQRYSKYNFEKHLDYIEFHQESKLDEELKEKIRSADNPYYHLSMYSLNHYMSHGVMEYIKLVNHIGNPMGTFYGQHEFNVYFKALRLVGVPLRSFGELNNELDRTGVYTTFFGPFYLDFGLLGAFILVVLGYFSKKCYHRALQGNIMSILFYCYIAVVILGAFFINMLSGSIIYYFNALIITSVIYKLMPQKISLNYES